MKKNSESATRLYPALPKFEIVFYVVAWISFYFWAVLQVFYISNDITVSALRRGDLEVKRNLFQPSRSLKDTLDFEWTSWNYLLWQTIICAFSLHFVFMRFCEWLWPLHRFFCSAIFSILFCFYFFGWLCVVLLLSQTFVVFFVSYLTRNTICTWVTSIVVLLLLTYKQTIDFLQTQISDDYVLVMYICTCTMCNLRYIAFSLELCWQNSNSKNCDKNLTVVSSLGGSIGHVAKNLILYQFYFPLLVGGPIINYNDFCKQIYEKPIAKWDRSYIIYFVTGIVRYGACHVLIDVLLYYFYVTSIHSDTALLKKVPIHALCGLALCYVQFFCLKYMVLYGLPASVVVAENLSVPGASHCVSGKHRFTDMWKYFDKGLHNWLLRYIYFPLGGYSRNDSFIKSTVNSAIPFVFVYVWHGLHTSHLYWAAVNWFGVYVEKIAMDVYRSERVKIFEAKYLSETNSRRLRAVFSSLPFSLLIVSNLYFLGGTKVGNLYMRRTYTESITSTLLIHVVLYFGVQTSMEISSYQMSKTKQA
ncbi:protein-cysteine N-palmitoyltransferase HHAT isoform X1 [Ciona intestinalis]